MQKLVWQNSLGDTVDLTKAPYGITNWEGFSNTSLNIQSQQVPFQDGGVFLDALIEQRELTVTLAMYDRNNLEDRYRMRRELIHILNPKLGEGYLIYTNDFISKRIKCVAQIPLFPTHNSNDSGTPKASLAWTACEPYWEDLEETEILINAEEITNIKNEGDIACQINLDLYNINTEGIVIKNQTNNKEIILNGLHNGIININTEIGKKAVKRKETKANTILISKYFNSACYDSDEAEYVFAGNNVIVKTKDLKTFEVYTINYNIENIFYFPETNAFIASGENFVIFSYDAINWEDTEINKNLRDILFVNEKYYGYIISGQDTLIYESTDGLNWTSETISGIKLRSVCYAEDIELFVGIAERAVYTSEDFIEWILRQTFTAYDVFSSIFYLKGTNIVIVGKYLDYSSGVERSYLRCFYSSNATTWTRSTMGDNYQSGSNIIVSGIRSRGFYMIDRYYIYNSITGEAWERIETKTLTYNKILRFDTLGDFMIFSSSTIETLLTRQFKNESITDISDIAYSRKLQRYVMITSSSIYVSENKAIWTKVKDESSLQEIVYVEDWEKFFVTCVANGKYLTSTDGIEWETYTTLSGMFAPHQIKYIPELKKLFVVGRKTSSSDGQISYTTDGINWQSGSTTAIPPIAFEEIFTIEYLPKYKRLIANGLHNSLHVNNLTYYSEDGGKKWNWEVTEQQTKRMYYARYMEKVFLPYTSSENGLKWLRLNSLDLDEICYSNDYAFFIGYKNTNFYISYNCQEWQSLNLKIKSSVEFKKMRYIEADKTFYIIGRIPSINYIYTIIELKLEDGENIISDTDEKSNMSLNLEIGNNEIRINCSEGFILGKLNYRQKYIGV